MTQYFAVDRIERDIAVLVGDDGSVHKVRLAQLGGSAAEGVVFKVPVLNGEPQWNQRVRDGSEERRRLNRGRERLDALRKRDPGGDVEL